MSLSDIAICVPRNKPTVCDVTPAAQFAITNFIALPVLRQALRRHKRRVTRRFPPRHSRRASRPMIRNCLPRKALVDVRADCARPIFLDFTKTVRH